MSFKIFLKGLKSIWFWISVTLMLICSLITLYNNLKIDNVNAVSISNVDMFYYSVMYFNIVINTIAPIFAILAAIQPIAQNNKLENRKEFHSHLINSSLLGGTAFVIFELLMLIILTLIYPSTFIFNISISGTFSMFSINFVIYLLMFLLNSFVIGFAYTSLSFGITYKSNHKFNGLIIPVMIYVGRLYYPLSWPGILNYLPIDTFDVASKTRPIISHIISILIVVIIAATIIIYKEYKYIHNPEMGEKR